MTTADGLGTELGGTRRVGDRVFSGLTTGAGLFVLVLIVAIGVFLLTKAVPAVQKDSTSFLGTKGWQPDNNPSSFGIAALVFGTLLSGSGAAIADHLRLVAGAESEAFTVSPEHVVESAIEIVRAKALRSNNVDWPAVEREVRAMAHDARTPADTYAAIRFLLAKLDDGHSFLMEPAQRKAYVANGRAKSEPLVQMQGSDVAYLRMPGFIGTDTEAGRAFVRRMLAEIGKFAAPAHGGWIIDLREDSGGNMWPMLAALHPFLGDGVLGSFESPAGASAQWRADSVFSVPAVAAADLSAVKIAVLTGSRTASAGEAVAIAFQGRPNTRFFGAPTAGQTTSNEAFDLPGGSRILLATASERDRLGRTYDGPVRPDQLVTADEAGSRDAVIEAALAWLEPSRPGNGTD